MNKVKELLRILFPSFIEKVSNKLGTNIRMKEYIKANVPERACHYHELFVRNDGFIYPCCLVWGRKDMIIGHLNDDDLKQRIIEFHSICHCESYKLIKARKHEQQKYDIINLELSLECQGSCAMCCVHAPEWTGEYNLYDSLDLLLKTYTPKKIIFQGGEVLIQKKSIDWISHLKAIYPFIHFVLVTNGNVSVNLATICRDLFSEVTISFVGYHPCTYKTVMGMNVEAAKRFAESIIREGGADVTLKYLVTPLTIHEIADFCKWAISVHPKSIYLSNSNVIGYLNFRTGDKYWDKIIERSANQLKQLMLDQYETTKNGNIRIEIESSLLHIFKVSESFIRENKLENTLALHKA